MKKEKDKKIVFVCTGNTCRSPMAEVLLKDLLEKRNLYGFEVLSAGIAAKQGDTMNPLSKQTLSEKGLNAATFGSAQLYEEILKDSFAIICMTEKQRELLMDMRWNVLRKSGEEEIENNVYSFAEISSYEVLDPYGRDIECYRYVYGLLEAGMSLLIEKLRLVEYAKEPPKRKTAKGNAGVKKNTSSTKKKTGTATKKASENKKKTTAVSSGATTSGKERGRPKKSTIEEVKENANA